MKGITDFFHSEKGLWGFLVPMLGATGMLIAGEVQPAQWMEFAKWMTGIYVSGKTAQGIGGKFADARAVGKASRDELDAMKSTVEKNDAIINDMIDKMASEPKRYAATPEG